MAELKEFSEIGKYRNLTAREGPLMDGLSAGFFGTPNVVHVVKGWCVRLAGDVRFTRVFFVTFQEITMSPIKDSTGGVPPSPSTQAMGTFWPQAQEMDAKRIRSLKWPSQGQTSWRGRVQLRTTLFTSRDGWDSSVGWL